MKKSEEKRATIFAINQSYLKHDSIYGCEIRQVHHQIYLPQDKTFVAENLYIQRKSIAPRRSKHLALETVREGNALNGAVEME